MFIIIMINIVLMLIIIDINIMHIIINP